MTRRHEAAEERAGRLLEQAAAHEAANAQLRQTIAEQREDRQRLATDRDEARQKVAMLEARLQAGAFVTDQVAGDAALAAEEAAHQLELAEQRVSRFEERAATYASLAEDLRQTIAEQQERLKELTEERDAARLRAAALAEHVAEESSEQPDLAVEPMQWLQDVTVEETPVELAVPAPAYTPLEEFFVDDEAVADLEVSADHPVAVATEIELDPWQREALTNWADAGHRGVIEAIAGAHEERLVHWSIGQALDAGMRVLVVVPRETQVEQWYTDLVEALPINRIGKYDGGKDPRLASYDVVVSTAQHAAKELGAPADGLLVAIDVHAFGTAAMAKALDDAYSWRLGLTTLYERGDDGIATYLEPYFGRVCFRLGYDRALDERVIAPFDLAMVAVRLGDAEQIEYDACDAQIRELTAELVLVTGLSPASESFEREIAEIAEGKGGLGRTPARAYLKVAAKRAEIVANTSVRNQVIRALAARIREIEPAFVFAPNETAIGHAARVLEGQGCAVKRVGSSGDRSRRAPVEEDADFCLVAEGRFNAEVPQASLALLLGDSRDLRQLVDRVGRVVGGGEGERSRIVWIYAEGTTEDDYHADREPVTVALAPYAAKTERFNATDTDALVDFISAQPRTPLPRQAALTS
jgi:superfamily II DNA or RNA helicase